jgi:hypothetical protein
MLSKLFTGKRNRTLAILLCAATIFALTAIGLTGTLAAKTDITEVFTDPNPAVSVAKVEVGATTTRPVAGAYSWVNSDTAILELTAALGTNTATIRGLKAGTAVLSVGTSDGYVQGLKYEITNSANITKYILSNGGEGIIGKVGGTLLVPIRTFITTTAGAEPVENATAKSTITWSTFRANDPVASVNASTGLITALSKGATIIIGKFEDKWGVPHDVHFLVAVGVSINDSRIGELLELIEQAQTILALDPNPYTDASLSDLESALAEAIAALDGTESQIIREIGDLQDAIDALVPGTTTPPPISYPAVPSGTPSVADTGRTIKGNKIGDDADWLEIATIGQYSLIVRTKPLAGAVTNEAANAKNKALNWYKNTLPDASAIRQYTVQYEYLTGLANTEFVGGISKPKAISAESDNRNISSNVLSYGDAAQYLSKSYLAMHYSESGMPAPEYGTSFVNSPQKAQNNYNRLVTKATSWTNTVITGATPVPYGAFTNAVGTVDSRYVNETANVYPTLWIYTAAFTTLS